MLDQRLTVNLNDGRSYPISIGSELLDSAEYFKPYVCGNQVCIVSNEVVAPLYLGTLQKALPGYQIDTVILSDGESCKTMDSVMQVLDCLMTNKHNRTTTLIALGGGVVGDITGFAAAIYQRGVNFIQVPTTLLSQVDSSVGGKTGVNHSLGKNMIGAFHQPQAVIIDTNVLQSLPLRELSAGIAEVIKYGLIIDVNFYQWLEDNISELYTLDSQAVHQAIARSCQLKAEVVEQDEKESGLRAILNLGHTFGHAIETAQGYGSWLHGEAVAVGMVLALELSASLQWISYHEVERLRQLLQSAKLPIYVPPDMSAEKFLSLMALDKKVINGDLRLVLLKSIGQAVVSSEAPQSLIEAALGACRE